MVTEKLRASWEWLLIGLGVIFYLLVFPHGIHGDGSVRYNAMMSLLTQGKFEPILYSIVGPLISAPLLLFGKIVKDEHWWISRFNTFIFFATILYFYRVLRPLLTASQARIFVLLALCATMFPKHVTDYYSEVFSACLAAIALWRFSEKKFKAGALLLALSVWNTPGTVLAASFAFCFFAVREKKLRYLVVIGALPAGLCLETYLKFGELFPNHYMDATWPKDLLPYSGLPGFSYPLFFGVLSVLFSFGKGLLFFTPGLVALFEENVWKEEAPIGTFLSASAAYSLGLLLLFSRWWAWTGDWFWGPRFYLFVSFFAAMLLLALYRRPSLSMPWRVFFFFAAALSFWVGCQGIMYGQDFLEPCYEGRKDVGFMCYYVPEMSVLWRPFVVWPVVQGRKVAVLIYFLLVAGTVLWLPARLLLGDLIKVLRRFASERLDPRQWGW